MRVAEQMTVNPKTCAPDTLLYEARDVMREGGFRRLPVLEDDALVGIITDRDIRSFLLPDDIPEQLKERIDLLKVRRVGDIMTTDLITIPSDAPLERAAEILRLKKFGGLPVVEEGKLVGIICQRDVMAGLLDGLGAHRDSFRFTIGIHRQNTDALSQLLHAIESQRGIVLSVLSDFKRVRERNTICYTIRVARASPEKLISHLKDLGMEAFDVITESPVEGL